MVSFSYLLSVTAVIVSAAPGIMAASLIEAAASPDIVVYGSAAPAAAKRDSIAGRLSMSKRHGPSKVVPYHGWTCPPWYPLKPIPSHPTCNESNCYRQGVQEISLPKRGIRLLLPVVLAHQGGQGKRRENGVLYHYLPWTNNCGAADPFHSPVENKNVVAKGDDVCAWKFKHLVKVALPNDYAALTALGVLNPVCVQHL
ncbi:hypothetical protein V8F33_006279 [Rhypophila sp. PSN 637]